jgi:NADH-quinone oxidoreductase subunit N
MRSQLLAVLPELIVLAAASGILVIDLFLGDARRHVGFWLSQLALFVAALAVLATTQVTPVLVFHDLIVNDLVGGLIKLFTLISISATLFFSRTYLEARGLFRGETFVLILFTLLGMMVMTSASNFLTLYLGLELLSLGQYAMVAMHRTSNRASEAAMKYFVLGALASGMTLYGMSMLYGATGSLDVVQVGRAVLEGRGNATLLVFGLVFVVSGIGFKLGAAPYHMWVPDVYDGAPTAMTLLIGSAPKLATFAFMLRLLSVSMSGMGGDWQQMLVVLAVLSMALGNLIAIAQTNIKRMLAYSTIANMGYMLMGFLTGNLNGYSAALFFTASYVLTTLASFGMVMLLSRHGFEADQLDDYRGLNQRSPWWAFVMLLVMFSLAGLPPTVGFYAKFAVIEAAVNAGFIWLAVVAVITSLIGAFYYLRIVKLMYFDAPVSAITIEGRRDTRALLSANGIALLVLGILPQPLMGLCVVALNSSGFL